MITSCECCDQPINTLCDEYFIDDDYNTQCEECLDEAEREHS
jgi:hypothetical protein